MQPSPQPPGAVRACRWLVVPPQRCWGVSARPEDWGPVENLDVTARWLYQIRRHVGL